MSWNIDRTMGLVHHDPRTAYEGFTLYSCVRGDDWEASRLAGVKRVIQASSGNTRLGQ